MMGINSLRIVVLLVVEKKQNRIITGLLKGILRKGMRQGKLRKGMGKLKNGMIGKKEYQQSLKR